MFASARFSRIRARIGWCNAQAACSRQKLSSFQLTSHELEEHLKRSPELVFFAAIARCNRVQLSYQVPRTSTTWGWFPICEYFSSSTLPSTFCFAIACGNPIPTRSPGFCFCFREIHTRNCNHLLRRQRSGIAVRIQQDVKHAD